MPYRERYKVWNFYIQLSLIYDPRKFTMTKTALSKYDNAYKFKTHAQLKFQNIYFSVYFLLLYIIETAI